MEEGNFLLRRAHFFELVDVGRARGGIVAVETHIAAERDRGEAPARAVLVVESEKFRAKADRESVDLHTAAARDPEMPELMEEYDDGQDEKERNDVTKEPTALAPNKLNSSISCRPF